MELGVIARDVDVKKSQSRALGRGNGVGEDKGGVAREGGREYVVLQETVRTSLLVQCTKWDGVIPESASRIPNLC